MSRMGVGSALLLGAALTLASLIGCVSPAGTERRAAEAAAAQAAAEAEAAAAAAAEEAAASAAAGRQADDLQAVVAALESEVAVLAAQVIAAQDEAAAARVEAGAAQDRAAAAATALSDVAAEAAEARDEAVQARMDAARARGEAARAQGQAERAQEEAGALRAATPAGGIAISPEHLDPSLLDLSAAQVAVAGPDTLYVSSIEYAGQPYSALLRYQGGTTATVERVFGPGDAVIPDSVDLSRTQLSLVAPDTLRVTNVDVGGRGFSGQLRHTGGNELEVAGIQRVTLPPAAVQQVARLQERLAAAQAAGNRARSAAAAAEADAGTARTELAAAAEALADARESAATAESAAAMPMPTAVAMGPPAVAVAAERLDPGLLSLANARASLAGPDAVYVTEIEYAGRSYSALLKYHGGTTATVERVYGPDGKLIPDTVGLARTQLAFTAPDLLDVAYVEVNGQGYSGQLRYAGGNRLEVAGIRRVTLPPSAAQQVAAAEAAAVAAAEATVAEAQAAAAAEAEALQASAAAAVSAARAAATAAEAAAAAAQAETDSLRAAAHQPAAVAVAAERLLPGRLSFASAQASVAGPDAIYVSGIEYGGQSYSALLRYRGGTSATVEQVYGPRGRLIPDSVGLAQARLAFAPPDALDISYVELNGQGYAGRLRYAGGNRLQVDGIRRVTLPPTAAQRVAAAEASAAAAAQQAAVAEAAQADAEAAATAAAQQVAAAQAAADAAAAEADQARAELAVIAQDAAGRRVRPALVDFNLLSLERAQVSAAGPESVYVSGIRYDGGEFGARLRYAGGNRGMVEELFATASGGAAALDLSAPAFEVRGPQTMVISNVGIGGDAYSFTLQFERGGAIVISQRKQGHRVRSAAELLRDGLLSGPGVTRVVNGIRGGRALPEEGEWITAAGAVASQIDAASSHAKFAFHDVPQPAAPTLYGVTVRAPGDRKVGYGLHLLASGAPQTGNTWNYGRSYLVWATRERDFYDTEATQVQLYESLDGNRLMWLNSRNLQQGLAPGLTLEALYQPDDCAEQAGAAPCYGSITVLVDGMEQFKVAVSAEVAGREADAIALRALGGPVEFIDLYVHSRR